MNKNEKKALISFLSIYVSSTVLMLSIILYTYYNSELKMYEDHCSMQMSSAAQKIRADILKAHMDKKTYKPKKLEEESINYALYDKDKQAIFTLLEDEKIDFSKNYYTYGNYSYHITSIDKKYTAISTKYIILQTKQASLDKKSLQISIAIILVLSAIFILFIGYLLSKLLLKPVREKILHMDNFIKDSAHELNTPVSVLLTSISTLKQGRNEEKMLKYILSSSKQISQIYNDIHFSAFNEINENVDEKIELVTLVQESVDFLTDISNAKCITMETNFEPILIFMDRTKTQKLVNNLISNAIKYSNKDSKIIISIKENKLYVQDFGIGISKDDQKDIFKRYKRGAKTSEGGFGIGLDIVSRINHEYNLKLSLDSKYKVGSIFCIDFSNIVL